MCGTGHHTAPVPVKQTYAQLVIRPVVIFFVGHWRLRYRIGAQSEELAQLVGREFGQPILAAAHDRLR